MKKQFLATLFIPLLSLVIAVYAALQAEQASTAAEKANAIAEEASDNFNLIEGAKARQALIRG